MSEATETSEVKVTYNDDLPRMFVAASVLWGIVGMLVGVTIALQLAWWPANVHPMLGYGRLRPLHTNAVIFAFVGNMMFAGIYHSTQRLVKARMASDALGKFHFWGWQAVIVAAAVTLPLGFTQGKEYAELEWPIDIAITVVWVAFAVNFFWTLARRNEKHLYVALWFYIATIITVGLLHIVNSLAIPVLAFKSYSIFGGAQDALVQWWYGHNAVAFVLTTPILGIMYYYVPKAVDRPVYSYRLSIVHFWSLIFMYIWAGPHHLLHTALPEWAQTLGVAFSIMLWAPSWGGMINGLFTIRARWERLRDDPVLKFFVAGLTAYGMTTFEGPLLSIRSVSALGHYTDWIIAHVHNGALGWNGFFAAGMFYYMIPRLYGTKLYSTKLANLHFYLGTFGIVLYVVSMWVAGITQGLMLRAIAEDGSLVYPTFIETLIEVKPMYWTRVVGGTLYLTGFILMAVNLAVTARSGKPVTTSVMVARPEPGPPELSWAKMLSAPPFVFTVLATTMIMLTLVANGFAGVLLACVAIAISILGALAIQSARARGEASWHRILEGRSLLFSVLAGFAVLVGGVAEIVPSLVVKPAGAAASANVAPYTALEVEGRDVYLREGCYTCHSQMIRTLTHEAQRYGAPSELSDSQYDHPFQWGSKRTGPDLARVGGKYSHAWHYQHMNNPRAITVGSNMPPYDHLEHTALDYSNTPVKLRALAQVGVPYRSDDIAKAEESARAQARTITAELATLGTKTEPDTQLIAVIAYLQRLGKNPPRTAPVAEKSDKR